jgi:hypothetical protein
MLKLGVGYFKMREKGRLSDPQSGSNTVVGRTVLVLVWERRCGLFKVLCQYALGRAQKHDGKT